MELRIRGDRRVPYRIVEPILDGGGAGRCLERDFRGG